MTFSKNILENLRQIALLEKEVPEGKPCHCHDQRSKESNYDSIKIKEQISEGQK